MAEEGQRLKGIDGSTTTGPQPGQGALACSSRRCCFGLEIGHDSPADKISEFIKRLRRQSVGRSLRIQSVPTSPTHSSSSLMQFSHWPLSVWLLSTTNSLSHSLPAFTLLPPAGSWIDLGPLDLGKPLDLYLQYYFWYRFCSLLLLNSHYTMHALVVFLTCCCCVRCLSP